MSRKEELIKELEDITELKTIIEDVLNNFKKAIDGDLYQFNDNINGINTELDEISVKLNEKDYIDSKELDEFNKVKEGIKKVSKDISKVIK
ncbi:MAG: hypothetical protein ACRCX7_14785 [Cetobacterium sp.]|uniref:hypothetical protein n=1 Tax=Cetobacterium sp. TaxID=2071632 RepID=UPI003F40F736